MSKKSGNIFSVIVVVLVCFTYSGLVSDLVIPKCEVEECNNIRERGRIYCSMHKIVDDKEEANESIVTPNSSTSSTPSTSSSSSSYKPSSSYSSGSSYQPSSNSSYSSGSSYQPSSSSSYSGSSSYSSGSYSKPSKLRSYDDGYDDVWDNDDYDEDRYDSDPAYARGVDDAMDDLDW